jgi:hypothetical protein
MEFRGYGNPYNEKKYVKTAINGGTNLLYHRRFV